MSTGPRAVGRAVTLMLAVAAGICLVAPHANAGGSSWYFDRPFYEPGDRVAVAAAVSWAHNDSLGSPEDGPYGVWIIPYQGAIDVLSLADQVERGLYVGDVRIELGPGDINGTLSGPNIARAEFTLPDVAPGYYTLLHCNYPCTTQLGDIVFGAFWVGPPDPSGIPTTGQNRESVASFAATPTTAPPTTPSTTAAALATAVRDLPLAGPESDGSTVPIVAGILALALAVGSAALVHQRRRRA